MSANNEDANKKLKETLSQGDQNKWSEFSKAMIQKVSHLINEKKSFIEILELLAHERNMIAKELGHIHESSKSSKEFGEFATTYRINYETHSSAPEKAKELIVKNLNLKENYSSEKEISYTFLLPTGKVNEPSKSTMYKLAKFIDAHHDQGALQRLGSYGKYFDDDLKYKPLSQIEITKYDASTLEFVLRYPTYSKYDLIVHYAYAEELFQSLISWDDSQNLDFFLENAAKLSYLMAHRLPVNRGTSSIVEWIIKGIAKNKGLQNFPNVVSDDEISWSWRALVEPDIQDYMSWYKKNTKGVVKKSHNEEPKDKKHPETLPHHSQSSFFNQNSKILPPLEQLKRTLKDNFCSQGTGPKHVLQILESNSLYEAINIARRATQTKPISRSPVLHKVYLAMTEYNNPNSTVGITSVVADVQDVINKSEENSSCSIM